MVDVQPILDAYGPFLLVMFRFTGLFVFTPLLASAALPRMFKVLLAMMFAVAAFGHVPEGVRAFPGTDAVGFAGLIFVELFIGVALGLIASLPLLALEMAGTAAGYQMGLALAQSFNPEMESTSDAVGQMLFFLGAGAFILTGGLDRCFLIMCESFSAVPIGAAAGEPVPLDLFVALLSSGTELALRIAAPVFLVVGAAILSMGLIMKTMPQINIMSVGFSAQLLAGLAALALIVFAVHHAASEEIVAALDAIEAWLLH